MLNLDPNSSSTVRNRHKKFRLLHFISQINSFDSGHYRQPNVVHHRKISIVSQKVHSGKAEKAGVSRCVSYFSCVFSDTQIPDSDSSLGVKVLTGHVDVIRIFIFILILAVVFPLLQRKEYTN